MGRYCDYNGLMAGRWHSVTLPIPFNVSDPMSWQTFNNLYREKEDEARAWCVVNTHGRWSVGHTRITSMINSMVKHQAARAFLFKGPNDALLFKLTWGGG